MGTDSKGMNWFGVWLKTALVECGMTQRDFCKIMYVTDTCVSRWIHGSRTPTYSTMEEILKFFGYHIEIVPDARGE